MKCDKLEKWYAWQCSPSFVVYGANDVDATITELKSENERLKAKLESVQASAYADSVDAGMRERRLRRALYKACANWAYATENLAANFLDVYEAKKWAAVYARCIKKAEEYR